MVRNDEIIHDRQNIDTSRAVAIARKFLEQYHSPVIFKSTYLNNKTWIVAMEVGLLREDIMVVKIDAETGNIQGYDHVLQS